MKLNFDFSSFILLIMFISVITNVLGYTDVSWWIVFAPVWFSFLLAGFALSVCFLLYAFAILFVLALSKQVKTPKEETEETFDDYEEVE